MGQVAEEGMADADALAEKAREDVAADPGDQRCTARVIRGGAAPSARQRSFYTSYDSSSSQSSASGVDVEEVLFFSDSGYHALCSGCMCKFVNAQHTDTGRPPRLVYTLVCSLLAQL